jgi:hypothetical protein
MRDSGFELADEHPPAPATWSLTLRLVTANESHCASLYTSESRHRKNRFRYIPLGLERARRRLNRVVARSGYCSTKMRISYAIYFVWICMAAVMAKPVSANPFEGAIERVCGTEATRPKGSVSIHDRSRFIRVYETKTDSSDRSSFTILDAEGCRVTVQGNEIRFSDLYRAVGYPLPPYEIDHFPDNALNTLAQIVRQRAQEDCAQLSNRVDGHVRSPQDRCITEVVRPLVEGRLISVLQYWNGRDHFWDITVYEGKVIGAALYSGETGRIIKNVAFE